MSNPNQFQKYMRTNTAEMTPYVSGMDMSRVSISQADLENGSPKKGDMIARNPKDHSDMWLVANQYFSENFALLEPNMSWQDRVIAERDELNEKHDKLVDFIENNPQFGLLEEVDQDLLTQQEAYMEAYVATLNARIERF